MSRSERLAPLTGVAAVVLWVVGTFLLEKDDRPDGKDTAAFVAWVEENDSAIVAGGVIFGFGVLFFLWMLGSLRSALAGASCVFFALRLRISIDVRPTRTAATKPSHEKRFSQDSATMPT